MAKEYLDELVQKITTEADLKGFDELKKNLAKIDKQGKQVAKTLDNTFKNRTTKWTLGIKRAAMATDYFGKVARRALGIFFGIQGVRSIIQTTRDLDLLQKSIQGLTGSAKDWEYLREEAYRTGTSLKTIAGAYKNFYSAASGSGFNSNQIQGMFSGLLTAGRGIGASQQQIGGALVALEQMLSKGKVSMEELRKQLGNALPGAMEIAQRAMGVTGEKFNEMMKKGISAAEFVPKFIAQAEKELGKGFKENIKSLDFALVNLNTAWMEFQKNILKGEAGEALAQLVRDITEILRSQELLKFIQLISKALALVIKNIRIILLLFGVNKIMQYINSFKNLHNVLWDIATTTGKVGHAAQLAAEGYALLTSGKILSGAKSLIKAAWAMCAPFLKLGLILAGIVSWFMILQDLWLFFTDKNADTITGRLLKSIEERPDLKTNPLGKASPEEQAYINKLAKKYPNSPYAQMKFDKNGKMIMNQKYFSNSDNLKIDKFPHFPTESIGGMQIPFKEIQTPLLNIYGSGLSSGNYSNSDTKSVNNNLTINISAPNSQPETIAQATEEALQKFFTKYNMGFA